MQNNYWINAVNGQDVWGARNLQVIVKLKTFKVRYFIRLWTLMK